MAASAITWDLTLEMSLLKKASKKIFCFIKVHF